MKKLTLLVLFVFTITSYSQNKTILQTDTNSSTSTENYRKGVTIGKWTTVSLSSGISTPSSNFSNDAYAKNGNYFELAGAYYFSKFGIGVSIGQISSPTNKNFSSSINSADISTTNTTQNWKQFYYGIGPEYKAQFGNFSATFSTKIGLQSVKSINLESNYTNAETPIAILKIKSDKNTSLSYFSTNLKFGYNINSNFSLFATANYMSAFSNGITISKSKIADTNKNGIIDAEDLKFATGSATIDYEVSTKNIKPQSTNFGIGLSYSFSSTKSGYDFSHRLTRGKAPGDPIPGMDITIEQGNLSGKTKRKRPGRTKYSNITLKRSQAKYNENNKNNGTRAIDHNASRSNTTASKTDSKGDGNDDDENNGTRAIDHNASRSNTTATKIDSKGGGNSENQQGYTKESTMIFVRVDETSLRKSNTKIPKDKSIQKNDKRMSKRTLRSRKRHGDKRYRERTKARTLRSADKRYRERTKGYRVQNKENTIQNDKPVQIITEGNNKVNPSTNLDTRFLKVQNYQTIHIAKSKFQLTAPLIISKNQTEPINYNWTVKNNKQNKEDKFSGKTINYNFEVSGTYEIEITPIVNNKNLNSYHINIICN